MAELILDKVCKTYPGNNEATIDELNLVVKDGEFLVLVGPSGCGKSTVLRLIAGLEEISSGTISIAGKAVNNISPKDRDIAMVFQNYALYPHMTVYNNMAFALRLRGMKKDEIDKRVQEAAAILDLDSYLQRRPAQLSGGQRQRVAVGRAIVRQPKAFLFDEPLSNLDAKLRVQMRSEIVRLHKRLQSTMIYVTHDQVEAMTMGERICVMKDGEIQQLADPITLYNHPENVFVAGFIGNPPANFFKGELLEKDNELYFVSENFSLKLNTFPALEQLKKSSSRKVILSVRPEHFSIMASNENNAEFIKAEVEMIEAMGAETFVYLKNNDKQFIARVDAGQKIKYNEIIKLKINLQKAHFYNQETELLIC